MCTPISEANSLRLGRTLKNSEQRLVLSSRNSSMLKGFRKIRNFGSRNIMIMSTLIFRGLFFLAGSKRTAHAFRTTYLLPELQIQPLYVPPFPLRPTLALSIEGSIGEKTPVPIIRGKVKRHPSRCRSGGRVLTACNWLLELFVITCFLTNNKSISLKYTFNSKEFLYE
jgi:hypothetical protein